MSLASINHNQLSANVANTLNGHYNRLSTSVRRLSTGLRVNSAADDAAGLAIRELMRSEAAALHQGMRNVNDAISLLQTADGALGVIDEKLIRMKELAEQAATGTYDSTQRGLIDSEFQAMGAEIDRIARATDFNGLKLLDGSLSGAHDGRGMRSLGRMKIHFGSANDSAEDYYYIQVGDCTTKGLGLHDPIFDENHKPPQDMTGGAQWISQDARIDWDRNKLFVDVTARRAGPTQNSPQAIPGMAGFDFYTLPVGLENIVATSSVPNANFAHKAHINLFTKDGVHITGIDPTKTWNGLNGGIWWNRTGSNIDPTAGDAVVNSLVAGGVLDTGAQYDNTVKVMTDAGESRNVGGTTITIEKGMSEFMAEEVIRIDKITSDLVFTIGGHDTSLCGFYNLKIEADITPELRAKLLGDSVKVETEFTRLIDIKTQGKAQEALVRIDDAIVAKDKIRANLGALQNRFENTSTNITTQAENLLAAESRISDTDVALEMTNFVRNQILTQSAVAMLGQANNMPQALASLLRA